MQPGRRDRVARWFRGVFFCAFAAPALGAAIVNTMLWLREGIAPAIVVFLPFALIFAFAFAFLPALACGVVCTAFALHWRESGASSWAVRRRLSVLGTALGVGSSIVAFSLWADDLVLEPIMSSAGAAAGYLVAASLPRVLWGSRRGEGRVLQRLAA